MTKALRYRKRWLRILAAGVVLAAVVVPAAATTGFEPASMERLTGVSDLAVHGTVESIHSERDGDRIFTYIEVRPEEVVKGLALPAVTLRLYGGVYENTQTKVIGAPCLTVGEEVFLFLKANGEATFDVVNLSEGKFRVLRPAGEEPRVERDLSGIRYVRGGGGVEVPDTLAGLKAAVRAAAREVVR